MKHDHRWLEQWQNVVAGKKVLELGSGDGRDSRILADNVASLVACDLNVDSLAAAKSIDGRIQYMAVDHAMPLPFVNREFEVVIASLTLHYFKWSKTVEIIDEIFRVLNPSGALICRVNSRQDVNYGATGHRELEPGLYDVYGHYKRFFNQADIHQLFTNKWLLSKLEHKTIDRYVKPKNIWEFNVIRTE